MTGDRTPALLDAVLREALEEHHVPGAVAGIVVDDTRHFAAHGVGNAELPRPVDPDTLFQVGSITKTFTSTAVMMLVEDGLMRLEDPLERHLPGLGAATGLDTEAITIEVALDHRAGFDGDHLFVRGERDGLAGLADARRFFEPTRGWSYNNAAFSIVGEAISSASDIPYEELLRDRVLGPLGMGTAAFRADDVITRDVAAPHWVYEGTAHVLRGIGWQPGWELGPLDRAAGGLVASVRHLIEWCRFQWTGRALDSTEVVTPASLERLRAPIGPEVAPGLGVGLDWFVRDHPTDSGDVVTTIEHGGTTVGYVSELLVAPSRRTGLVCLTNATNGAGVIEAVRRTMLAELLGIEEEDPEVDPSVEPHIERLLGTYEHAFAVLTVTAGADPATVVVTPSRREVTGWQPPVTSPVTFGFHSPHDAVSLDVIGPVKAIRFDPDGETAAWVLWDHRRAPRTA